MVSLLAHAVTPTKPASGSGTAADPYQISNAAELWGFAAIVNGTNGFTQNRSACAVLINDIELEKDGNWIPIGSGSNLMYLGTFNGNNHTISNLYMKDRGTRSGFFGSIQQAVVKNFKINGEINVTQNNTMIGVIGDVDPGGNGTSLVEDIHSSITINCSNSNASRIGGIVGCATRANSTINRCRFSGTINAGSATAGIGGVAGDMRGGKITNCLFDGTIESTSISKELAIGGLVGKRSDSGYGNTAEISNSFSNGTITLVNATNPKCGAVLGYTTLAMALSNVYYDSQLMPKVSSAIGDPGIQTTGTAVDKTLSEDITNGYLHFLLGETNWKQDATYPVPGAGGTHTHRYDANGYCIADGEMQPATLTDGYYQITNAGNLFWFQKQVNAGNSGYNAKLTADINLDGKEFTGIGTIDKKYAGIFDGQGHVISVYQRTESSGTKNYVGFFGVTNKATIKGFTLSGTMTLSQTQSSAFNGTVVGLAESSTIEDVISLVNITCTTANPRLVAGIAGRLDKSTINRCHYHGTINTGPTGDQVGGIVASIQNGCSITNSLFDGKIICSSTAEAGKMHIGGLFGFAVGGDLTLSNNLVVGTITLAQNAVTTNCGLVYGNLSNVGKVTSSNNFYTTTGSSLSNAGGSINSGQTVSTTEVGSTEWFSIQSSLGTDNWVVVKGHNWPIPGEGEVHIHNYTANGFCYDKNNNLCNTTPYEEAQKVGDAYMISNGGQLFWFAKQINEGKVDKAATAVLTADINLEEKDFPGIGSSDYKYSGIFNGQNHTISGYKHTTTDNNQGLFNYVEKATIAYFNLTGSMSVGHSNVGSVVGTSIGVSKISDVTSSVTMTITSADANAIGGLIGSIGSTSNTTPALVVRCRYNGTINAGNAYSNIGGLIGVGNSLKIGFCLFDGTINAQSTNANKSIGGIIAGSISGINTNTIALYSILSHGTITLGENTSKCGIINGDASSCGLLHVDNTYYTKEHTGSLTVGPSRSTDYVVTHEATTAMMTSRILGTQLGFDNWYWCTGQAYPIPGELHTCNHSEEDEYGLCKVCSHLSPVEKDTEGAYLVTNASDFGRIRSLLNSDQIVGAISVKMTKDIDMSRSPVSYIEPLGTEHNPFMGTFDGQGHSFIGVTIEAPNHDGAGFFGYVKDATIKNLSFKKGNDNGNSKGTMTISHGSSMNAPVVGYAMGKTTLEDIVCEFDITVNHANASQIGGIVGATESDDVTLNRCRYSGTITFNSASDAVGGIVGTSNGVVMKNCLFDGKLSTTSTTISVGGFIGTATDDNTSITNSLSHGTYSIASGNTKAGLILGYANQKSITLDKVIYTNTHGLTALYGSARTGETNATTSYPKCMTVEQLKSQSLAELGEANWKKEDSDNYPHPGLGGAGHEHSYNDNGFCPGNDGIYQPAEKDIDSYYKIENAGQLWWIAEQINSDLLPRNTKFKLANNIDMEGAAHGSFPGIGSVSSKIVAAPTDENPNATRSEDVWSTAFTGIFDGKGYTINDYYRNVTAGNRQGLINAADNATIKNFTINGTMNVLGNGNTSGALAGVVAGSARGNSLVEDITCNVNIVSQGARGLGGIVGTLADPAGKAQSTMNRCRYNGTITLSGKAESVGGLVGELRSGYIKNSLFDGTITAASGVNYTFVGGLVGKVTKYSNSEMHRNLCHGTITLASYSADTNKSGIVIGGADRTLTMSRCFHTTSEGVSNLPVVGPSTITENSTTGVEGNTTEQVSVNAIMGTSEVKESTELKTADFRITLGESNWANAEIENVAYTYPKKDASHIHKYSNGFCVAGDGDYERPNSMGSTYQIDNAGKLYWFAEHFNAGEIPETATVEIVITQSGVNTINMEGDKYSFPGIGNSTHKFKGTFNGHGNILSNIRMSIVNSEYNGLIGDAENATIKDFTLMGEMRFNLASTKNFHGTVVGRAMGAQTIIEDVTSSVNVYMNNQNVRVFGGIAGRAAGQINRCNYSGNVYCNNSSGTDGSGRQIGGICGNAQSTLTISNCIFDGTIESTCKTAPVMRVSGILASNEQGTNVTITIKNSLFNGCLKLNHSYTGDGKSTENGLIAGYLATQNTVALNNVFSISKCPDDMKELTAGKFAVETNGTPTFVNSSSDQYWDSTNSAPNWNAILSALNGAGNTATWKVVMDQDNKAVGIVPNTNKCTTHEYNDFGWCTKCNARRPIEIDTDQKYKIQYLSDLATFRDLVNSGTTEENVTYNAKLMNDLDFAQFPGELGQPIGNSYHNRYLYNFDGQGYAIRNIRVTANQEFVGMFGFAGDATHSCTIKNFTITGYINTPYRSSDNEGKPLHAGVVGKMYNGVIENVHSEMAIQNQNETEIILGGILGCAETDNDANSVTIRNCSYTGNAVINGYGNMGGIIGETSRNTLIENCLFTGSLNHTYQGDVNMTQFGGVVGYNENAGFMGVKNCVIAGVITGDEEREFVTYDKKGNHKNILAGQDTQIEASIQQDYSSRYANNYAIDVQEYRDVIPEGTAVKPQLENYSKFASGEICAALNASNDDANPWGQIIGYQVGGVKTEDSPAQLFPVPGYRDNLQTCYKVVKGAGNNYTIDYLFLDDNGDTCPLPSDAASIKAKKISYTRAAKYMTNGFVSVCMPFALDNSTLPGGSDCKVKLFDQVKEENGSNVVYFEDATKETDGSYKAGIPYFLYLPESARGKDWNVTIEDANGFDLTMDVTNPETGILGSFETVKTGAWSESAPMYKIKNDGVTLVKTTASSNCYPYRGYLKLPTSNNVKDYVLSFEDYNGETIITDINGEVLNDAPRYNLMGQKVNRNAKGIIITGGKKVLVK